MCLCSRINIKTGEITLETESNVIEKYNISDFVQMIPVFEPMQLQGVWGHLKTRTSPIFGLTGYLEGKYTEYYSGNTVNLKFSAGTSVAVIAAVLVAISIQGTAVVSAICWALGSAIVGTAIAQSIDGTVRRQIRQWDYRVIVKNIITFTSYKQDYYARVVNAKTGAISFVYQGYAGETRTYDQMIDAGIWNYALMYGY